MISDALVIIGGITIIAIYMLYQIKAIWRSREMLKIIQDPSEYLRKNAEILEKLMEKEETKQKDNDIGYS